MAAEAALDLAFLADWTRTSLVSRSCRDKAVARFPQSGERRLQLTADGTRADPLQAEFRMCQPCLALRNLAACQGSRRLMRSDR